MFRPQIHRLSIDMVFSRTGLNEAWKLLLNETEHKPVGLVLSPYNVRVYGEIVTEDDHLNGLRIVSVASMPEDVWMLYNNCGVVISSG